MAYLEAEGLTKIYQDGARATVAVQDATFQVEHGEFVAIVGRSGSGKSTLMHLLGCLDRPTAGTYRLNGQSVAGLSPRQLAAVRNREIGFVFQQFHLIPTLTALENVALPLLYRGVPRRERHERAARCLYEMGLGERLQHKPHALSGGQQQRVAIARAMVGEPSLLLADEPTGNLDTACAQEVMAMLHTLHRSGHTLLLITHDTALANALPRRLTICDGRVTEDDTRGAVR